LAWGIATLLVFRYNIELLQDSHTPFWSFVVLLLLIFGCEIIPIFALLDYSYMNMIGFDERHWRDEATIQPMDLLLLASRVPHTESQNMIPTRIRWHDEEQRNQQGELSLPLVRDAE
jgi:hypothetical protein